VLSQKTATTSKKYLLHNFSLVDYAIIGTLWRLHE